MPGGVRVPVGEGGPPRAVVPLDGERAGSPSTPSSAAAVVVTTVGGGWMVSVAADGGGLPAAAAAHSASGSGNGGGGGGGDNRLVPPPRRLARVLAVDAAGRLAAVSPPTAGAAVSVVDASTGATVVTAGAHTGPVLSAAFSPPGGVAGPAVASGGMDGVVRLVRLPAAASGGGGGGVDGGGGPGLTLRASGWVPAVGWSPSGAVLAAGDWAGTLRAWSVVPGCVAAASLGTLPAGSSSSRKVKVLALAVAAAAGNGQGVRVVGGCSDGGAKGGSGGGGVEEGGAGVHAVAASGAWVAAADVAGSVRLWAVAAAGTGSDDALGCLRLGAGGAGGVVYRPPAAGSGSLSCPVCGESYGGWAAAAAACTTATGGGGGAGAGGRVPYIGAGCGHPVGCGGCVRRLMRGGWSPPLTCGLCGVPLGAAVPHYELLRLLEGRHGGGGGGTPAPLPSTAAAVTSASSAAGTPAATEVAAAAADAGLADTTDGSDDAAALYIHPSRLSPPPPDPPTPSPTASTLDTTTAVILSALPGGPSRLTPDGAAALRRLAAAGTRHPTLLAGLVGVTAIRPERPLHLVTPAAAGGTLAEGLAALHTPDCHGALAAAVAADIGRLVVSAVSALHGAGLVHGRLTPAAVGLSVPLREWVVGTSSVLLGGVVPPEVGGVSPLPPTPTSPSAYLPPESLAATPGAAFDDLLLPPDCSADADEPPLITRGRRVDAYAAGVILWELFAGAPPYAAMSASAIAAFVVEGGRPGPVPQRGGEAVAAVVEGAWAALPEERLGIGKMEEMLAAGASAPALTADTVVGGWQGRGGTIAPPPPPPSSLPPLRSVSAERAAPPSEPRRQPSPPSRPLPRSLPPVATREGVDEEQLPPPPMSVNRVKGWGARRRV
ncbi:hypothetical protein MMPV_006145 [Pyropia vietnamensis]